MEQALSVDLAEWQAELPLIEGCFTTIGDKLPTELRDELDNLRNRLTNT